MKKINHRKNNILKIIMLKVANKAMIKKVFSISFSLFLFIGLIYVLFSPIIISVEKQGINIPFFSVPTVKAISQSVTLAVGNEATVTSPGPLALTGTINGVSGGTASGTVAFGVLSSSNTGFSMSVSGGQVNALHGTNGYDFFDYAPAVAGTPDFNWVAPIAGSSAFGYISDADAPGSSNQKFRYTTTAPCNVAGGTTNDTSHCWYGLSTTPLTVVTNAAGFKSSLTTETLSFQAQYVSKSNYAIPTGTYTATITVTVSPTLIV